MGSWKNKSTRSPRFLSQCLNKLGMPFHQRSNVLLHDYPAYKVIENECKHLPGVTNTNRPVQISRAPENSSIPAPCSSFPSLYPLPSVCALHSSQRRAISLSPKSRDTHTALNRYCFVNYKKQKNSFVIAFRITLFFFRRCPFIELPVFSTLVGAI